MDLECLTLAIYSFTLTSQDWKITLVKKYYFCPDIKIFQRHFDWKKTTLLGNHALSNNISLCSTAV